MSETNCRFKTKDAFVFVDTYRTLNGRNVTDISDAKKALEDRYWNRNSEIPNYWAQLRAHEAALEKKASGHDPEEIVLGDTQGQAGTAEEQNRQPGQAEQLLQLQGELGEAQKALRKAAATEQEMKVGFMRQQQALVRAQQRLRQNNAAFLVVGFTMLAAIVVLLTMLVSKG